MHQPDDTPRPSLYFPYRVHEPWLPRPGGDRRHQVVIVGSGPGGLVTALELARHGVSSVILTSELQVSQGSRAIVFTRRTMEILQQVGVSDRICETGLPWRFGNSHYRGQRVFRMEAPHEPDDRFAPMTNLQQQFLEQYLLDACAAQPLIELRWGNRLTALHQQHDGVVVHVDTPERPYQLEADWLVAADGGRSTVRSALGLPLEGESYEGRFVIADIKVDLPLPTERLAFFDPEWNPGNTVLMHREPYGIWRVDYQLGRHETAEQALEPSKLAASIDAQLASIGFDGVPWTLDWCSVYSARALTLADYVHRRVLFMGDAAHLLPIFGVRGANTAFQDAQSLGWHLAFVARGVAPAALLGNYSQERVGAAREIISEAGRSTRFMTPPTDGFQLLRDAVLSLSLSHEFVRPLYHWRTSRAHVYEHSKANSRDAEEATFRDGPAIGEAARNVKLADGEHLLDHLGGTIDMLLFDEEQIPGELLETAKGLRSMGIPLRIVCLGGVEHVEGADLTLVDRLGRAATRYGVSEPGGAYLLRPDQHVCARWKSVDGAQLKLAVQTLLAAA